MVTSNKPLIKEGSVDNYSETTWKELLRLDSDPNRKLHIRKIEISLSTFRTTNEIAIRLKIDGKQYLREFYPVVATTTLTFGGDLTFEGKTVKPPILVEVKSESGAGLYATCIVTGIETKYGKSTE